MPVNDDQRNRSVDLLHRAKKTIKRRFYLIPLSTAMLIGILVAYIYIFPPVYKAELRILLEDQTRLDDPVEQFYYKLQTFRKSENAATEAELILSDKVAEEVIEKLNLTYNDVYHSFFMVIIDIWRRSCVRKQYKKVKKFFVKEKPLPMGMTEKDIEHVFAIKGFKKGIKFAPLRNSNVYKIVVKGPSPSVATVANTLMKVAQKNRLERHSESARGAYDQINCQLETTEKRLEDAEKRLQRFVEKNKVFFEFEAEKAQIEILAEKEGTLEMLTRNRKGIEKRYQQIQEEIVKIAQDSPAGSTSGKNPLVEGMKSELFKQELILLKLRENFAENSKEVTEQKKTIEKIKQKLRETSENQVRSWAVVPNPLYEKLKEQLTMTRVELVSTTAQKSSLENSIDQIVQGLLDLPQKQYEATKLIREVHILQEEHRFLMDKRVEAEISSNMESMGTASMKIVDWARTPSKPAQPKTKFYLIIAVMSGIFIGIGNIFLFDYFDSRVRAENDEAFILNLPVFTTIPHVRRSDFILLNGNRKFRRKMLPLLWGHSQSELIQGPQIKSISKRSGHGNKKL